MISDDIQPQIQVTPLGLLHFTCKKELETSFRIQFITCKWNYIQSGTYILRHTGMCRSLLHFFPQETLNMSPIQHKYPQNTGLFLSNKFWKMGLYFRKKNQIPKNG